MKVTQIQGPLSFLGENPIWYENWAEFLYADIGCGKIYSYNMDKNETRTVFSSNLQIGAFLECQDGALAICSERGIIKAYPQNGEFVSDYEIKLFPLNYADERFNDGIVDSKGRMLLGTKRDCNKDGRLLLIENGKLVSVLLENLVISNGMSFSLDGKKLYHTDSVPATVTAYDYDVDAGTIANPKLILQLEKEVDPDGMAIDENGTLWSPVWAGKKLINYDETGIINEYEMPYNCCTSICFGGNNYDTAFITSASYDSTYAGSGSGLIANLSVKGIPCYKANF